MQWTFVSPHSALPTSLSVVSTVSVRDLRRDVGSSFRTHQEIEAQVDVDAPRLEMRIQGVHTDSGDAARRRALALVGERKAPVLLAMLTQAGMGLPYELLHGLMRPHHVAEPTDATKMRVEANLGDDGKCGVRVEKTMRVFSVEESEDHTLHHVDVTMMIDDFFGEGQATVLFDIT